jgi:hypothetical protein
VASVSGDSLVAEGRRLHDVHKSQLPVISQQFDFTGYQPGDVLCISRAEIAKRGMTDTFMILSALSVAAGKAGLLIEPTFDDVEMRVIFK